MMVIDFFVKWVCKICNHIGELIWRFEREPLIIVRIDGGLASQIVRATLGKWFEEEGYNVRYDLRFYDDNNAYDNDHIEKREYRLNKCFPSVNIRKATARELRKYKLLYDYESGIHGKIETIESWNIKKPIYFTGYSSDILLDWKTPPRYFNIEEIRAILGEYALSIYEGMIKNRQNDIVNVGVHVRRGDMTKTGGYWKVLTGKYFIEAVKRTQQELANKQIIFYFFSNGFDFVNKEILPFMEDARYVLVDGNKQDYEDFYLYCKCDIQVQSQGSWGMLAYSFNECPNKRMVTFGWGKELKDSIYIELEDDMYKG